jgi:ubiquinone/menaquinone biosynthesis C-methylase UbiE
MYERRFQGEADRLRAQERIALLEVDRVADSCLSGLAIGNVLDVGTGTGVFAEAFATRGLAVTGIDSNARLLSIARRHVPAATFQLATAEALPFAERSFDLVFLGHVLHEVDDRRLALCEARRVCRHRVSILEWPYRAEELGPPLQHRLRPEDIEQLARETGYSSVARVQLAHMVLHQLAP